MNTIKIYLAESGRIADLQKDFPLYQGQFQNKLLNIFVPTSILAPEFTSQASAYAAATSVKIGMTYTARDGSIKVSKNYFMRYLKTLMYKGVEYALYERKLPKEFTFYAGQGENSPVLIVNVVNIEQQSGDTPPLVLSVITSQTCHLDVMQSTFLDRDELDEPSELENLNAQVQALNALMPKKQDKEDESIALEQAPAEKTVVGAINELGGLVKTAQSSADTAQQTAETAQTTADNTTGLANNAVATANGAVATANEAKTTAQTAENNANSAVDKANAAVGKANEAIMKADAKATSIGFMTAKDAVTALNGYPRTQLKGGDTIWIVEDGTPDLWVTEVAQESVPYNYTTKDKFNQDLVDNKVLQIGYFKTAYQESDGKPVTIAWQNVLVKSTDWVASTEFADFPYEAKIELTDFVDYTTVPQVVFDIADTMSGNYAPICKSGDKCVYIYGKTTDEITLKTVITFAPNVNGASITGGGYNNRGKWVASTTYAIDDLVYTDNGQFVCIEGITSTTSPEQDTQHWQATFVATGKTKNGLTISGQDNGTGVQKTFDGSQAVEIAFDENTMTAKEVDGVLKVGAKGTVPEALPQEASALKSGNLPTSGWTTIGISTEAAYAYTISDTSITANSDILMELTDDGGVKSYSMEAGKITVIRDTVPTQPIPYTYKVKQTNASGQFTLVNHYVQNIPVTSVNGQTGAVTIAVPTKTSDLQNDSGFAKTTEANTWTDVQTFSNADGIKTDRVHNLDNNDEWYNFDGSNNRFGSPSRPTIIRTSEARPRAQVPSGETTVTKEIALLEDVQGDAEWSDIVQEATVSAGLYYVLMNMDEVIQTAGVASIVFYDGTHYAHGIPNVNCGVGDGAFTIQTFTPYINPGYDKMTATYSKVTCENGVWTQVKMNEPSKFKYRKIK